MLYDDITTAVLAAGYQAPIGDNYTAQQAEQLQRGFQHLKQRFGRRCASVSMFVPGDSATDHSHQPDMPLYASALIFGIATISVSPWEGDCPALVSQENVRKAFTTLHKIPTTFWSALQELLPAPLSNAAELHLFTYGPLPAAALTLGVLHPSEHHRSAKYQFYSCQDMDQGWLSQGVDAVHLAAVDFADIHTVDLGVENLEKASQSIPALENPALYLTVRYD